MNFRLLPSRARQYFLAAIIIAALLLLSCSSGANKQTQTKKAVDEVKISGSGTCLPVLHKLAAAYRRKNPDSRFVFLPSGHSSLGVKGVTSGTIDIGAVSRELDPEEQRFKLKYHLISNDGLVVAVHRDVNITNLSKQQVCDIYSGKIKNWSELGGQNAEIVILDRNEDESAKIILRKYVLGSDLKITEKAIPLFYESEMVETLTSTPNTIGYLSLGYAISEKFKMNIVSLDGITPSIENIENGKYQITRPLGIVVKGNPKGLSRKFINFIFSKDGFDVMIENGFAPGFDRYIK